MEVAIVSPGAHHGRVVFVDQAAPDEVDEGTGAHARLRVGKRRRPEDAIEDAALEMHMLIQARAKEVDEGNRSDMGIGGTAVCSRSVRAGVVKFRVIA